MEDVSIKLRIDARARPSNKIENTKELAKIIDGKTVVKAIIYTEEKTEYDPETYRDYKYKVEVTALGFNDGTAMRIDEEGVVYYGEADHEDFFGVIPSELYDKFRAVAKRFFEEREQYIKEFADKVKVIIDDSSEE